MTQTPTDALRLVPVNARDLDALRYVLNRADDSNRIRTVMTTFTLPERETTAERLERLYAALKAAPASPLPGGGWQDISTAPKDGTVIDVWRDDGGRDTVFWGMPHHDCGEMGRYCDSEWHGIRAPGWVCNTFNEFVGRNHNPFTHWMPLPAAPTGEAT